MDTDLLLKNQMAAITAIRDTGATQLITVSGNSFTCASASFLARRAALMTDRFACSGGHSWTQESNGFKATSDAFVNLKDPLNNMIIELHEYLDSDVSSRSSWAKKCQPSAG